MVKHTKGFKGLSKKVLSAILAASMIMTSSSFVMAAEPTEEPEVAVESVAEDATIEEVAEEDEAEDETVVEEENEAENEEVSVPETKVAAAPANNSAATGKVADAIQNQIQVIFGGQEIWPNGDKNYLTGRTFEYEAGNPIEPELTMTDVTTGKVLNKGTDYDLAYENNTVVSSTTTEYAKMIVTFRGAYGNIGTYTFNYKIVPREIKEKNATVYYATEEAFKYTGEVQYPVIERVVVRDGDETYELGEGDYKIVKTNNEEVTSKNVGNYKIKVVGAGNYKGVIDSEYGYSITPAELSNSNCSVSVDPIAYLANLSVSAVEEEIASSIVVYDGVNDRELGKNEYTIRYMDEKTGEYDLKRPSAEMGVHQFRICGKDNYDENSYVDGTYQIVKENSLQMAVNDALKTGEIVIDGPWNIRNGVYTTTYNGTDKFIDNDKVVLSNPYAQGKPLASSQYRVVTKRADWTNAGVYYITIEGRNNFAGDTATIPVHVVSRNLIDDQNHYEFSAVQGTHRSGAEGSVEVTVRDKKVNGGVTLTEGVDYVYSVEKRTWGKKYVHITGIGNYARTIDKGIIVNADKLYLSDESITAEVTKSYVYTGKPVKPTESDIKLVEKDINNEYEITDDDFRVVGYRNNVNAGEATVIIAAKDDSKNYVGRREITFTIGGLDFADTFEFAPIADVEIGSEWADVLDEIEVEYQSNGATYASWHKDQGRCKFEILKDGKRVTYTGDTDLAKEITEAGEYVVKATPVGNRYAGTLETTFTVKGVDVAQNTKVADIADQVYTGEAIEPEVTVTNDNMTLVEGKDYTVSYSGNVEGGTAVAIIKGIGNYSGTIEKEFTITQGQQELSMTNPLQERDLENGSRTTKSKVCTLKLGYALEDKNMSLSYDTSDASVATVNDGKITYKGVGECTITVTAKETNNCKADTLEIKVVVGKPGQPTFTPSVTSKTAKKSFVVTSSTIPGADGFEVQYSIRPDWWRATTKDFTNVSAGGKLYRQVLTTYHSNKTYYIRVRAYQVVDGEKVYSDWSPAKTATTK